MADIGHFGTKITLSASVTFPNGIAIDDLSEGSDPFDIADLTIAETGMGTNGTSYSFSKAVMIPVTLVVIPNTDSHKSLSILLEANRVAKGKKSAKDVIKVVRILPDGSTLTLTKGRLISGNPGKSLASAGRIKDGTYKFEFEAMNEQEAT